MLWNNPIVHCEDLLLWFNKQDAWSTTEQKRLGGRVKLRMLGGEWSQKSLQPDAEGARDECTMLKSYEKL